MLVVHHFYLCSLWDSWILFIVWVTFPSWVYFKQVLHEYEGEITGYCSSVTWWSSWSSSSNQNLVWSPDVDCRSWNAGIQWFISTCKSDLHFHFFLHLLFCFQWGLWYNKSLSHYSLLHVSWKETRNRDILGNENGSIEYQNVVQEKMALR